MIVIIINSSLFDDNMKHLALNFNLKYNYEHIKLHIIMKPLALLVNITTNL